MTERMGNGSDETQGASGKALSWLPLAILALATISVRTLLPAWLFMWVMAFAMYIGCKWLTWRREHRLYAFSGARLSQRQQATTFDKRSKDRGLLKFRTLLRLGQPRSTALSYFLLWPGMDAEAFAFPAPSEPYSSRKWLEAGVTTVAGLATFVVAARASVSTPNLWIGWLGMLGIILLLHFGLFELLGLAWRRAGSNVKSVMRSPVRATSPGDFWGRRWNTAFSDLAHKFVFRPLVRLLERRWRCGDRADRSASRPRLAAHRNRWTRALVFHDLLPSDALRAGDGSRSAAFRAEPHDAAHEALERSAGFQPAISPISNRRELGLDERARIAERSAGWKPCDTAGWKPALLSMRRAEDCALHLRSRAVALATLGVFLISGLVHELVISVPARAGYGLPTAYFLLQGFAVLVERSGFGRRIGLGRGLRGWLFMAACTAGPAFWLFHPPFVRNVILPMLQTFGGR
jgi:hypothetical protein